MSSNFERLLAIKDSFHTKSCEILTAIIQPVSAPVLAFYQNNCSNDCRCLLFVNKWIKESDAVNKRLEEKKTK